MSPARKRIHEAKRREREASLRPAPLTRKQEEEELWRDQERIKKGCEGVGEHHCSCGICCLCGEVTGH